MNNFIRMTRNSIILMVIMVMGSNSIYGQWSLFKSNKAEKYKLGPDKNWSQSEHQNFYDWRNYVLDKQVADDPQVLRRQKAVLNGNKITTEIWNYGSISSPGNTTTDIVWEGLGYGYEFGPFICAEIEVEPRSHLDAYFRVENGDTTWYARAISDGLVSNGGEVSPDGSEFWGWQPLAYNDLGVPYADPISNYIPTSNDIDRDGDGKPDSWPEGWYNENLREYKWPGALKQGASNSDMESFFVVDDRENKEFDYYPFPGDSTRKGLGLEIEFRYYQWSNPLAEDIIFLIYKVTNISPRELKDVTFGMWGDPHVGGPSNWQDDLSYFEKDIDMVYCWDADNKSDVIGREPGYFGYKFLESPGNPYDGIDNDNDGMVDESQSDGIDNDGDWDIEKHDIGVDGLPNTGDEGENDGVPTAGDPFDIRLPGEPNFEWTDLDESDMIGLTGFASPQFGGNNTINFDNYVYENFLTAGVFDSANANTAGDYIFIYSSGPIDLPAGETRRFSIALAIGQNFNDLTLNAVTAQQIYERNYQFAKPPAKPNVTAVAGNEKVTLYWDDIAESSIDPISEKNDFEGYAIYRSTNPQFLDQQTITDAFGSKFLFEPLEMVGGASAKFDLDNDFSGLSNILYTGHGIPYNLGNNTGLRHTFIDSNNIVNGQNYYYAVVSYDHGDADLEIAPTECSKQITLNPESNELFFDVNTLQITPRAPAAGYLAGTIENDDIFHSAGIATGDLMVKVVDPIKIEDQDHFEVTFSESPTKYSIENTTPVTTDFIANIDKFIGLQHRSINENGFILKDKESSREYVPGTDYELDASYGRVKALSGGSILDGETYTVQYTYYPIIDSQLLNFEESNPIFEGLQIFVQDNNLEVDNTNSAWSTTSATNYTATYGVYSGSPPGKKYPGDFEIRFKNSNISIGEFGANAPFEIFEVTAGMTPKSIRFAVLPIGQGDWEQGKTIVFFNGEEGYNATYEITFYEPKEDTPVAPTEGDVFYLATKRSFANDDIYTFTTIASKIENEKVEEDLDKITIVPNPYVVTNTLEQLDLQNPRDRGPRRVYFNHLPAKCDIRIYTMSGELVETIHHESAIDDGKEYWDLTTKDNFPIAFGVYLFHVDAGELGEKIGRFAVIK